MVGTYDGVVQAGATVTFSGSASFTLGPNSVTNLSQSGSLTGATSTTFSQRVGEGTYTLPFDLIATAPSGTGGGVVGEMTATASSRNCNDWGVCGGPTIKFLLAVIGTVSVPGSPTGVSATPGNGQATVSWQPPPSDGGAAITSYTATSFPDGATCAGASTSCTVKGLANGQAYTFTVKATNVAGDGPASGPSAPVIPRTLPGAPAPLKQTATVQVPKKIKYMGKTVLLKKAVRTSAEQKATSMVTVSPKGKKYSKVKTTSRGKVIIRTLGKKKLKVTLKLTAPATGQYASYSYTKKWTVKK